MNDGRRPTAVDLFCGAGGMSLGFEQAGFDILGALDIDPINVATYRRNFPSTQTLAGDIDRLADDDLRRLSSDATPPDDAGTCDLDLVFGGPSCQGFSEIGRRDPEDARNTLVHSFAKVVRQLQPRLAVMENVTGLLFERNKPVLQNAIDILDDGGYLIVGARPFVLDAQDFGVPQRRERVFLLAARRNWWEGVEADVDFAERTQVSVEDALRGLPSLEANPELLTRNSLKLNSEERRQLREESSPYALSLRSRRQGLAHPRTGTAPSVIANVAFSEHHPTTRGRFSRTGPGETEPVSRLPRLDPAGVSPTLRAGTNRDRGSFTSARPIHHREDRVITVREGARLHSFPDWFRFHETRWHGFRQVGNSVPPLLAAAVAGALLGPLGAAPKPPAEGVELGPSEPLGLSLNEAAVHVGLHPDHLPEDVRSGNR